ncbi:SlyX family protein [Pseudoalteromonas luteoviolacea]|uniref:Protein SlyX homolog n=1 Tax=Pseudoalteromonas luteoviolacea H33 TaxID=1365251 RepID=A0A161Y526_9GAMM|nr:MULTISPECIES: SlyX family protein [Pseudoalteromonas]KZN50416.1 SlyX [Pseudoalteromonas luteoviolacea H33]KZN77935.1 SlyX [Pseudoalteromonas luteoviolacea H33-S]MBQ4879496.1 SlyX family protein [Pseudoalteromonas luteoviolacea]MBQ4908577.1 SlyX family protein [Pseudoalteromonas luteoviolacea]MCF6442225.1 SlyX family protein [Pseudoalteromonas luteoviolacea]
MTELESRVNELEAKIAFQEDTIETLNDELKIHQARLSTMQHQIRLLAEKIKEGKDDGMMPIEQEPPPPHY